MKITKAQSDMLDELIQCGSKAGCSGVVAASSWTTGRGRYAKCRSLPPFTEKFDVTDERANLGRVRAYLKIHPRTRTVVAVTNMRAAKKALAANQS